MTAIHYRTAKVDNRNVFYREAGASGAPKLLLLHGFPTSGHMFRDLIPLLADRFHIVAPDLPGFGNSDMPDKANTFDKIAATIDRFTETIGFDRYAVYVFDYGAPTGFRLAVKHPDRITAIISQNGNAYEEGLIRSGPIGRIRLKPIAQRFAPFSSRRRPSGNIPTACRTRRECRRTGTRSTISICPGPASPTCNSTCSAGTVRLSAR
jgi:pimeloyl-ACP methyl ester carboxylesterase